MMSPTQGRRLGIDIDIHPSPVILAAELTAISVEFKDYREPLTNSIKNVMMPSIRKNFDVGGRPSWAPLSAATLSRRAYEGSGITGRILSRTAALRRRAASFGVWKVNNDEAHVGSLGSGGGGVPWAKLHQEGFEGSGGPIGRIVRRGVPQLPSATLRAGDEVVEGYAGDIPARPFLVIQPEDEDKIAREFHKWTAVAFAKHGWAAK
jgi:phage gpG-like protein